MRSSMLAVGLLVRARELRSVQLPVVAVVLRRAQSSEALSGLQQAHSGRITATPTPTPIGTTWGMAAVDGFRPIITTGANGGPGIAHGIKGCDPHCICGNWWAAAARPNAAITSVAARFIIGSTTG
jgi:phage tail tape-measure protein